MYEVRRHVVSAVLLLITLVALGCSAHYTTFTVSAVGGGSAGLNSGRVVVAVTSASLKYVASFIGGDEVVVYSLVPAGVDPHHFEPSTSFLVNSLSNATVVLMTGPSHLIIEARISELVRDGVVRARIVDYRDYLRHGLKLRVNPGTGRVNPHGYLMSYSGLVAAAAAVAEVLAEVDPNHGSYYNSRLQEFKKLITMENRSVRGLVPQGMRVILFTPILQYVAHDLGLKCTGVVLNEPGTELSEGALKALVSEYGRGAYDVVLITDTMAVRYPKVLELLKLNRIPYIIVPTSKLSSTPNLVPAVLAAQLSDIRANSLSMSYQREWSEGEVFGINNLATTLAISEAVLLIVLAVIVALQRRYIESRVVSSD